MKIQANSGRKGSPESRNRIIKKTQSEGYVKKCGNKTFRDSSRNLGDKPHQQNTREGRDNLRH